jgi:2-methylaconitate cis-trans-isomerase PrpF
VAIAVASIIPGTVLNRLNPDSIGRQIHFGHPSGSLAVGAEAIEQDGVWTVSKAVMSRSARRLMIGQVLVPSDIVSAS